MSGFQSANNNNTDMFPQDYADKDILSTESMKPTNTKKATNSITSDVLTNSQKTT